MAFINQREIKHFIIENKKFLISFCIILLTALLVYFSIPLQKYNLDNYRYTISAVLQSLASIFALIASVSIIVFQFTGENSPTSIKYLPIKFFHIMICLVFLILISDTVTLMFLPNEDQISTLFLIGLNLILFLNGLILFTILFYILRIINWFNSGTVLNYHVNLAEESESNEERLDLVLAMEELAARAISKGHSSNVKTIILAYITLIDKFLNNRPDLNKGQITFEHPISAISDSLCRLTSLMTAQGMHGLIYVPAKVFAKIIQSYNELGQEPWTLSNIFTDINDIIEDCLRKDLNKTAIGFAAEIPYRLNFCLIELDLEEHLIQVGIQKNNGPIIFDALNNFTTCAKHYIEQDVEYFRKIGNRILETLSRHRQFHKEQGSMPIPWKPYAVGDILGDIKIILETGINVVLVNKENGFTTENPIYKGMLKR